MTAETLAILDAMGVDPAGLSYVEGARDIEWGWVMSNATRCRAGNALDFGCGRSPIPLWLAQFGHRVTAVDLERQNYPYEHGNLSFKCGDIRELGLREGSFDLIINCSSIEHAGISGRYGVGTDETDGDIEVMGYLYRLLKKRGVMIFTTAVGRDNVFAPLHRIYGYKRLPMLLDGYRILSQQYWAKDDNKWHMSHRMDVLGRESKPLKYGLGLFVLERKQ